MAAFRLHKDITICKSTKEVSRFSDGRSLSIEKRVKKDFVDSVDCSYMGSVAYLHMLLSLRVLGLTGSYASAFGTGSRSGVQLEVYLLVGLYGTDSGATRGAAAQGSSPLQKRRLIAILGDHGQFLPPQHGRQHPWHPPCRQ